MKDIKYTPNHEWLEWDGDCVKVGITHFAQGQMGDLVFIDLPTVGTTLSVGDEAVIIESVKAAGDISMPVAGTVVDVNGALEEEPELVNEDPMGAGWFLKIRLDGAADLGKLMSEKEYLALVEE